jgi:micrococcal nuclease
VSGALGEVAVSLFIAYPLRVIDGDTFTARIDLEPFVQGAIETHVRIAGIDAPELRGETKQAGQAAKAWLEARLKGLSYVLLFTHGRDSFGRLLADVSVGGADLGVSLGPDMIAAGVAAPYRRGA